MQRKADPQNLCRTGSFRFIISLKKEAQIRTDLTDGTDDARCAGWMMRFFKGYLLVRVSFSSLSFIRASMGVRVFTSRCWSSSRMRSSTGSFGSNILS